MIRSLVIVFVAALVTSVVCLAGAVALGGPVLMHKGPWSWNFDWDGDRRHVWRSGHGGAEVQRDFAWAGTTLEVNAPAEIDYVQAAGPAKLTIRGPAGELDRVRVENGRISVADGGFRDWDELRITLSAPDVHAFDLNGANKLRITGYDQPELSVTVSGQADVSAAGKTRTVNVRVSGAGETDLADLKTAGASIEISGAGQATVAPTDWAKVEISGMGDVNLLTKPARLETHVSGAGRIRQPGQSSITAGASAQDDADDEDDARGPKRPA